MKLGLLGRKLGMTRVFKADGQAVPVTVIEIKPNVVSQIKNQETDGYSALQLTSGQKKSSRINKALAGHFAKANIEAGDLIAEFLCEEETKYNVGDSLLISDLFSEGQYVDVAGTSKGKGFAGTVKRHNFRTQDATHGNSRSHRVPGSIGQNQTPGRVFKGKKMAGHLGNERCTVQSLEIIKIDQEKNVIMIKGAIPGAPGGRVEVRPAVKKKVGA
jgi:large subunit ribosomal protein L3